VEVGNFLYDISSNFWELGSHSLALAVSDGATPLFSWGGGSFGQLGLYSDESERAFPTEIKCEELEGEIICNIACGKNFSFAVGGDIFLETSCKFFSIVFIRF
jgi:hypothetical protein